MIRDYLKSNDIIIKNGTVVNSATKYMMPVLWERALNKELDEELGYSEYDYKNKHTDNNRNGYSNKTMHTSYGNMEKKILPIVKEWQERFLEEIYAVVLMAAIHYHIRSEGRIVKRAVCISLEINMNDKKDVLGMYVGENESAKFWLSIMNGLKIRGAEDILIAYVLLDNSSFLFFTYPQSP